MLVGVLAGVKVSGRQLIAGGRLQLELLSVGGGQVVRLRVEVQSPSDGQRSDDLIKQRALVCYFVHQLMEKMRVNDAAAAAAAS